MTKAKLDSMYELTKTLEQALVMVDEDGVLTDEAIELMHKTEMNIVEKTGNIFGIKDFIEGQIDLMKNQKKYIDTKKKVFETNLEKLRKLFCMGLDTVPFEVDEKTGKKTQKIKTPFGTAFYKFSDKVEIFPDEVEEKFFKKKVSIKNKNATREEFEELKKEHPGIFNIFFDEVVEDVIDEEALKEAYDNGEKPKGIKVEEEKILNLRK